MDIFDFDVGLEPEPQQPTKRPYRKRTAPQTPVSINMSNNTHLDVVQQDIDIAVSSAANDKSELTDRELKFIECRYIEHLSIDESMIQAGYGHYHQRTRYSIASRITQKYEARAQDRRNLFRMAGAGELRICMGLLDLAQNARSEQVRRAAWADLASCMGMKQEQVENFQGVTLNVYSQEEAKRLGIETKPPASSGSLEPQHIQITK
ncbi:MAG: hypothetical protein ACLPYB_08945 [Desulfobaccales bacterium]